MKPNVIVIHADQHRAECLGVSGNKDVKTPRIDSLAADGVRYTSHFCCFPYCTPSRYSLLTGMYASAHCGMNNQSTLPGSIPTFATRLRDEGYRTAAVGKMHFTPTYLDVGFDSLVLAEQDGPGRYDDDYHKYLRNLGLLDEIDLRDQRWEYRKNAPQEYFSSFGAGRSDLPCEHHSTTYISNNALDQIGRFDPRGGNLLMVGYIKPHHPFDPPEPYSSMYDPEKLTLLDDYPPQIADRDYRKDRGYFDHSLLTEEKLRYVMSQYYGAITHIDDGVGRILGALKEKGMYDDAMIVYTSDHGEYLGFRHMLLKGNHMYDPLTRIPLIVKYPASWSRKGVDDRLSSNVDVANTILSVCGVEPAETMRGLDLTGDQERAIVVCENSTNEGCDYMMRSKARKLLVSAGGEALLFDLTIDPHESTDVSGAPEYQGDIRRMKDKLIEELFLHRACASHQDSSAHVVNGKSQEEVLLEREEMAAYMRGKSTVKPAEG